MSDCSKILVSTTYTFKKVTVNLFHEMSSLASNSSKNKTYCILLLYIGALQLVFYWSILPEKTSREIFIEHKELLEYPCCVSNATDQFHSNIVFLKPDIIGGSVVLNIILRFSLRHSLDVLIPEQFNSSSLIPVLGTETVDNMYNVALLFNKFTPNVYYHTYSNTFTVTIIEHPISMFQTLYNKYKNTTPSGTFKDFVNKTTSNVDGLRFNPITTRLGLKPEYHNNETAIQNFIHEIEGKFDLIMIYEHLGPSLILLANLMGWPLDYVTNMYSYVGPARRYNFTDINKIKLAEWNMADIMFYDHFVKKLENCALQYGVEQLISEMNTLDDYIERDKRNCLMQIKQELEELEQNDMFSDCNSFVETEDEFIQRVVRDQTLRMSAERALDYLVIY